MQKVLDQFYTASNWLNVIKINVRISISLVNAATRKNEHWVNFKLNSKAANTT